LRFQEPDVEGDHVVLLVSERVGHDYLAHLQDAGVSYLFCGKRDVDVKLSLDKIRRVLGIRRLMLEGGGTFNGAVLDAGVVDEISQVVVPVLDGGRGIATIFDIPGDPPRKASAAVRLDSYRRLRGGVMWLRYRVRR
jgi:riboflavin biosynthesis pyrimidine reductase